VNPKPTTTKFGLRKVQTSFCHTARNIFLYLQLFIGVARINIQNGF